jgi:hypothetical protein
VQGQRLAHEGGAGMTRFPNVIAALQQLSVCLAMDGMSGHCELRLDALDFTRLWLGMPKDARTEGLQQLLFLTPAGAVKVKPLEGT